MSGTFTINDGYHEHIFAISGSESEIMTNREDQRWEEKLERCPQKNDVMAYMEKKNTHFAISDFGKFCSYLWKAAEKTIQIQKNEFISVVKGIHDDLSQESGLIERYYRISYMFPGERGRQGTAKGISHGYREKSFRFYGTIGICYVVEIVKQPDETYLPVKFTDLRARKKVVLDDGSIFRISSRKAKFELKQNFKELLAYLADSHADQLTMQRIDQKAPTVLQLVRILEQGGGAEDDAGEALFNMGNSAKEELIRMLYDSKRKKYHLTIALQLKYGWPTADNQKALDDFVNREPDTQRRNYLMEITAPLTKEQEKRMASIERIVEAVDIAVKEILEGATPASDPRQEERGLEMGD